MKFEISSSPHPAFPDGRPVEIGNRFLLIPEGADPKEIHPEQRGRIPIRLWSGKAFGSGLHETTASCIGALEELAPLVSSSVLDMGTGTGILSIAAVKLGAENVLAFDTDMEAASLCRRNADLTGTSRHP